MPARDKIETSIDYTLKVLLGDEHANAFRKYVSYSEPGSKMERNVGVRVIPSGFFGEDYGKPCSLPRLPLKQIEGTPLLYGTPKIQSHYGCVNVHADIIASTFFLVTRYEEMVRRDVRDEHGRFPGRQSLPYRAGFINRPIIDEYAGLLRKWLRQASVKVRDPERKFSVLLTHDVDIARKYRDGPKPLRTTVSALLGRQPKGNVLETLAMRLFLKKDPLDTFEQMVALDARAQRNASPARVDVAYFFMSGGQGRFDGYYNINARAAQNTLKLVRDAGANIGLHASYEAGSDPERITEEKAALERACGCRIHRNRHHFLAWREVEHGWALAKAGITWDSSLGYADVSGFRLGVCRPIPLFDPVSLQPFGIQEHPLILMDATLTNYMKLSEQQAIEYCKQLADQTRKHNGEFVMLWHNTELGPNDRDARSRLYVRLLSELVSDPSAT